MKTCNQCGEIDQSKFSNQDHWCRPCRNRKKREYYASNPDHYKRYSRQRKYNLTQDQIDTLFIVQGGLCGICEVELGDKYCMDHDHSCCGNDSVCGKCIRGLLCYNCNTGLAKLQESEELVARALRWIQGENLRGCY